MNSRKKFQFYSNKGIVGDMIWHVLISRKLKKNDYKTNFLEVQIDVLDISIENIFNWRKEYRNELSMFKTMLG